MARKQRQPLTPEELGAQSASELPNREALSLIFASVQPPAPLIAAVGASSQAAADAAESAAAEATPPEA